MASGGLITDNNEKTYLKEVENLTLLVNIGEFLLPVHFHSMQAMGANQTFASGGKDDSHLCYVLNLVDFTRQSSPKLNLQICK